MVTEKAAKKIAAILPHRELYQRQGAGAISACVHDVALFSKYRQQTIVLGDAVSDPFDLPEFMSVTRSGNILQRRTKRYYAGVRKNLLELKSELSPELNVGLIEVHNRPLAALEMGAAFPQIPILLYLHNDPLAMKGFGTAQARADFLQRGHYVLGVSDFIRRQMLKDIEKHAQASHVFSVLNGVDTQAGDFNTDDIIDHKKKEIIFVGRIIPEKGALLFAQAAQLIAAQLPDWKIVLIGTLRFRHPGTKRKYDNQVYAAMEKLGRQGEITGYLPRNEVLVRMRQAAIMMVPSLWQEPCSLVALEAMSSACAVIAMHRGGLPEVLGDAGILINNEAEETWATAVIDLAQDVERCKRLQKQARTRAQEHLDMRFTAQNTDVVRDHILGRR